MPLNLKFYTDMIWPSFRQSGCPGKLSVDHATDSIVVAIDCALLFVASRVELEDNTYLFLIDARFDKIKAGARSNPLLTEDEELALLKPHPSSLFARNF